MTKINDLTHKIIACAIKVHNTLGNGFEEYIYQSALVIEMEFQGLTFERDKEMSIYYHDIEIGTNKVDFLVDNKLILEVKVVSELLPVHINQALNYCEAYNIDDGLLINFGKTSFEFKRVYKKNHINQKNRINTIEKELLKKP